MKKATTTAKPVTRIVKKNVPQIIKDLTVTKTVTETTVNEKTTFVSDYKRDVIGTNKALKEMLNSVGACRSVLLLMHGENLPSVYREFLELSKTPEGKGAYNKLNELTRRSKSGKVSPFYVLQALHTMFKAKK